MRRLSLLALPLLLTACATAAPEPDLLDSMFGVGPTEAARIAARIADKPLGSEANPVRADMPVGQRAYLARLRCSNGQAPSFSRVGSMGLSPYGSIVDGYEVLCAGAAPAKSLIYIDMYHPDHVEAAAPPGFTIVP